MRVFSPDFDAFERQKTDFIAPSGHFFPQERFEDPFPGIKTSGAGRSGYAPSPCAGGDSMAILIDQSVKKNGSEAARMKRCAGTPLL